MVTVFLLVAENDNLAFTLTEHTSLRYLADYMQKDFSTMCQFMPILMELLRAVDGQLHSFLCKAGLECFFATSWLITWFAHDVKSLDSIARIFDVLLSSHPMHCYYLCVAVRTSMYVCMSDGWYVF